jgi:uncharacterized protein
MKLKFLIILVFTIINLNYAQQKSPQDTVLNDKIAIEVIARVQKDRILLRWAVNDPIAWKKLNTYGYLVERYTVTRDNKTLTSPRTNCFNAIL